MNQQKTPAMMAIVSSAEVGKGWEDRKWVYGQRRVVSGVGKGRNRPGRGQVLQQCYPPHPIHLSRPEISTQIEVAQV